MRFALWSAFSELFNVVCSPYFKTNSFYEFHFYNLFRIILLITKSIK